MMKAIQNVELLKMLSTCTFSPKLISAYTSEAIQRAADRMKEAGIALENQEHLSIQRHLIQDDSFLLWFKALRELDMPENQIEALITNAENMQIPIWNTSAQNVKLMNSLPLTHMHEKLRFFSIYGTEGLNCGETGHWIDNFRHYLWLCDNRPTELTDPQKRILRCPFFASYVSGRNGTWREVIRVLASSEALVTVLTMLYDAHAHLSLDSEAWQLLRSMPVNAVEFIRALLPLLTEKDCSIGSFFRSWIDNGMLSSDLQRLIELLPNMSEAQCYEAFESHLGYISALYGKDLDGLALSRISEKQASVLIYAIAEEQHSFLRLVRKYFDLFANLPTSSILFKREFFTRLTLNSITAANLEACGRASYDRIYLGRLTLQRYTFQELLTLASAPAHYVELYDRLKCARIDDKLIIIRQLLRHQLLPDNLSAACCEQLAEHLSVKPLDRWQREDMAHIQGLSKADATKLLAHMNQLKRFLKDFRRADDVSYAVRNAEALANIPSWAQVQKQLVELDQDWLALKEKFAFSDEFLHEHQDGVLHFISNEGAMMANAYMNGISSSHQEALRRIVQAELMGRFADLKYHQDDLAIELNLPISESQKAVWMENNSLTDSTFQISECDSFYDTIQVGEIPTHTCLSYKNGMHNECLLACFDTNKKILYAYRHGIPVARALIRLTKGSYYQKDNLASLQFADLEKDTDESQKNGDDLVLFLERIYTSGLNDEDTERVANLFVRLLLKKAPQLDARLVISQQACSTAPKGFISAKYNIFISRSKAGKQYLDSLGGQNTVSDEGRYRDGLFLVQTESERM